MIEEISSYRKTILDDVVLVYSFNTNETKEELLKYFFNNYTLGVELPDIHEWEYNIKVDSPKYEDEEYYEMGYYTYKIDGNISTISVYKPRAASDFK